MDRHHIEPVIQILPELAFAHQGRQVPVCGCDNPDIHIDIGLPAHAQKRTLFERAQQLGLNLNIGIGNLIQHQGSPERVLKFAALHFSIKFASE